MGTVRGPGYLDLRHAPRTKDGHIALSADEAEPTMNELIADSLADIAASLGTTPATDRSADSVESTPAPTAEPPAPWYRRTVATVRGRRIIVLDAIVLAVAIIALCGAIWTLRPRAADGPSRTVADHSPDRPTVQPTSQPSGAPTPDAPTAEPPIPASWGPGGARELAIDPAKIAGPKARYGLTWVLVALDGGGEVWIARGDVGLDDRAFLALPDLAPPPTPIVVERRVEVPAPCGNFSASLDVASDAGTPLGRVTAWGCTQAAADANAAALAAEMKARAK